MTEPNPTLWEACKIVGGLSLSMLALSATAWGIIYLGSLVVRFLKYLEAWEPTVKAFTGLGYFLGWCANIGFYFLILVVVPLTILIGLWAVVAHFIGVDSGIR